MAIRTFLLRQVISTAWDSSTYRLYTGDETGRLRCDLGRVELFIIFIIARKGTSIEYPSNVLILASLDPFSTRLDRRFIHAILSAATHFAG